MHVLTKHDNSLFLTFPSLTNYLEFMLTRSTKILKCVDSVAEGLTETLKRVDGVARVADFVVSLQGDRIWPQNAFDQQVIRMKFQSQTQDARASLIKLPSESTKIPPNQSFLLTSSSLYELVVMSSNQSNLYSDPPIDSLSSARWFRMIHDTDVIGILSKKEMLVIQSLVRRHARVLMCRETSTSAIPPSLSQAELRGFIERFPAGTPLPHGTSVALIDVTDFFKTGVHMNDIGFVETEEDLKRWGLRRFSFDWDANIEDRVNASLCELFWISFYRAIQSEYYRFTINPHVLSRAYVLPVLSAHFRHLRSMYHTQCNNQDVINYHFKIEEKQKEWKDYSDYLIKSGAPEGIVSIFQPRNFWVMGDRTNVRVTVGNRVVEEVHVIIPRWWSEETLRLMEVIEKHLQSRANSQNHFPGSGRTPRRYVVTSLMDYGIIPRHLPADMYSKDLKESLPPSELWDLKMKPNVLPSINRMERIFAAHELNFFNPNYDLAQDEYYTSDDDLSADELEESDNEGALVISRPDTELKQLERSLQLQISKLQDEFKNANAVLSGFQGEVLNLMPARLAELEEARVDIGKINEKLRFYEKKLESVPKQSISSATNQDS
ncbi:uncharacterized protein MELLADRAFT_62933 [Melampsora larici-populina 98AG31]|uniref:Uncharacterized protein n=1 Tax=Melampsora larici-populina (strain 98AG31 / pathotype 3-4-7) TaxID=747676 RepID=F4RLG3_MELLP|nr:uncharacterized protein MELLADRAFT_62933 [Melampsora larici-populina 98AG31]EGG06762.1 hypothetical protein MELLADRAFT_62933 [Melampsora larici-populina 98AG31]